MKKPKAGDAILLERYGRGCEHDEWEVIRNVLVGQRAILGEVLAKRDRQKCRLVIVDVDGFEIEWRLCSVRIIGNVDDL